LAKLLLDKDYEVYGTSRDAELQDFNSLKFFGIDDQVTLSSVTLTDFDSVYQCIHDVKPDEMYNLAGQSSVALSFNQPHETYESVFIGTLNCLEAIRIFNKDIRYYNACSSECFGDTKNTFATEDTVFRPRSPYAVAKASAYWITKNYRQSYDLFACSGILFNHDSPLRPEYFVTQKIISAAIAISREKQDVLKLGNIDIRRDWGWAPEYVVAMHLMLQQDQPGDFVVATGKSYSLKDFLSYAFSYFDLNWKEHVTIDERLFRPSDIYANRGNPKKVRAKLGWESNFTLKNIVHAMIEDKLNYDK